MNETKNCPQGGCCWPGRQCARTYDGCCAPVSIARSLEYVAKGGIAVEMEATGHD